MTNSTIDIATLAATLDTDPRTTRKFLRSITPKESQPGKGSRWGIDGGKANLNALKKQFAAFNAPKAESTDDDA